MCKQYPHKSLCRTPECDHAVGQKHRNVYCRQARQGRRLGKCSLGVEIQDPITKKTIVKCSSCKQALSKTSIGTWEKTDGSISSFNSSSSTKRSNKRKSDEKDGGSGKKRVKIELPVDEVKEANEEYLEVKSPVDKTREVFNVQDAAEEQNSSEEKNL
ncbi:hypothetical protein F4810DRAFT_718909 [Camillea tinctor]|nr:hypothetical protein F4810DRAFT_718909 [Camillea tinctor]